MGELGISFEKLNRSQSAKEEYFLKHKIEKKNNFELHHIVPFGKANTKEDAKLIDNYKNFIYLSKTKHKEFTKKRNENVVMRMSDNFINFFDFNNNSIYVENNINSFYNKNLKNDLNNYNNNLINYIYKPNYIQLEYISKKTDK